MTHVLNPDLGVISMSKVLMNCPLKVELPECQVDQTLMGTYTR